MEKRWCCARQSAVQRDLLKIVECLVEGFLVRVAGAHPNPNAPERDMNLGADFQYLQPNCRALRRLQLGAFQTQSPQVMHQDVGDRREVQPQLIAAHCRRTGPISKKSQLLFLDPVLHLAAFTVDGFIYDHRRKPFLWQ